MSKKTCVGCLQDVEDTLQSKGIGTICESCSVPMKVIPSTAKAKLVERTCKNCSGPLNFIGAFSPRTISPPTAALYFDCPNPRCSKRRMTIVGFTKPLGSFPKLN